MPNAIETTSTKPKRMRLGQYCGKSIRRRQVHGLVLTENRFAPGLQIDTHQHAFTHLTFVLQGGFTERYEGLVLECDKAATLFVPANEPHTDRVWSTGAHSLGVEFSPAVAERVIGQTGVLGTARVVADRRLEQSAKMLYREFRSADSASSLAIESLVLDMIVTTSRIRGSKGEDVEPKWMRIVREALHEDYKESVSLSQLADLAGVHETHLARSFRKRHGCTVGEYVRRLRLDEAARELTKTKFTIGEIAALCGFYDHAHFCRCFQAWYGVSPTQYRSGLR